LLQWLLQIHRGPEHGTSTADEPDFKAATLTGGVQRFARERLLKVAHDVVRDAMVNGCQDEKRHALRHAQLGGFEVSTRSAKPRIGCDKSAAQGLSGLLQRTVRSELIGLELPDGAQIEVDGQS